MQRFAGFLYLPFLFRGQLSRADLATQSLQPISRFLMFYADSNQAEYGLEDSNFFPIDFSFLSLLFLPDMGGVGG